MLNFENDILLLLQVIYNLKNLMQSYQPFLFSPDLNLYTQLKVKKREKNPNNGPLYMEQRS